MEPLALMPGRPSSRGTCSLGRAASLDTGLVGCEAAARGGVLVERVCRGCDDEECVCLVVIHGRL